MEWLKRISVVFLLFVSLAIADTSRSIYQKKYADENKVALVIGNGKYTRFAPLVNTLNDAQDIAKLLKEKNFDVVYVVDGDLQNMEKGLKEFVTKLQKGGVGFFYYAGHGLQINDSNYLIPINSTISNAIDVKYKSLPVNYVVDMMESAKNRLNIIVLDACRNDPFKRGGGGLAQINNARGMYIAFATGPGQVASDGNERNGLFTKHLLRNIDQPNMSLDAVFNQTRQGVFGESNGEQTPWTTTSVIGDFYFNLVQENNTTSSNPPAETHNNRPSNDDTAAREIEKSKSLSPKELDALFALPKIQDFLQKSLKAQEGHDLYGVLEYYDRKVEPYFDTPSATHDTIYNDKKVYFTQWSTREYQLESADINRHYEYLDSLYADISFKFAWSISNNERQKKGTSIVSTTLKSTGDSFKITAIQTLSTATLLDKATTATTTRAITPDEPPLPIHDIDTTYQSPNAAHYPYVCYDRRTKEHDRGLITHLKYEGCKRYKQPCSVLSKEHFGKYPNDLLAHKALNRCQTSRPRFVD